MYFHISRYLEANILTEFGGITSLRPPSKWTPKNQFFEWLKLGCQCFFAVSRYLRHKSFGVVWGYGPPLGILPKTNSLNDLIFGASVDISSRYFGEKYIDIVWGCHPPGDPPKQMLQNQFFDWFKLL